MRLTILFLAALITTLATVWADEPKPFLKLDGVLTTESDKESGFYPHYFNLHPVKLKAGRAYRMELVSKDFSVDLSVQDLAKKTSPEVGANPKPGNQGLTRLIYACELDGEHVVTVKGGGSRKVKGVADQIGPYSLAIYDISENEDEIVDFQMNHIFQLNDQERKRLVDNFLKRFTVLGSKLTAEDAIKAEFIAKSLENRPEERQVYESFVKVFAESKSPVSDNVVRRLETRNRGRIRFLSLPGQRLELHGMTSDGTEWDLKDHRGTVVVLYFYYAGAGVPDSVKAAYETYQGRVVVVGLSLDNTKEELGNSMKLAKNPWHTLTSIDRTDGPAKLFNDLAVDLGGSMPVILIDSKGLVVANDATSDNFKGLMEKLLGPKTDQK